MIKKVFDYVEKYHMLSPQDVVVTGVSGGADSVCLLCLLQELQKRIPFTIYVVHVNHMIRQEAGEDENFVRELCQRMQIPFFAIRADVEAIARREHITSEEAGRTVRYDAFENILKKYATPSNGKIAIAHNKNDSAETLLFHLFRGSGIQGLTGILPVRGHIIRPLLCLERSEIEAYLESIDQPYCTDATNLTDVYARNRIRHHVLQFAKDEICTEAVAHTQEAAEKITDIVGFVERASRQAYERCAVSQGKDSILIKKEALQKEDKVLHSYILIHAIESLIQTKKDIASVHVEDILGLLEKQSGKHIDLPYGLEAGREYEGIIIRKKDSIQTDFTEEVNMPVYLEPIEGRVQTVQLNASQMLEYGIFPNDGEQIIPEKTYTKWFDYDKIIGRLSIRKRAVGDYLTVNDRYQKQLLKAFFINEKIPRQEREQINLLADDNHIMWVIGSRISSFYKVSKDTKRILKVSLRGGVEDG